MRTVKITPESAEGVINSAVRDGRAVTIYPDEVGLCGKTVIDSYSPAVRWSTGNASVAVRAKNGKPTGMYWLRSGETALVLIHGRNETVETR